MRNRYLQSVTEAGGIPIVLPLSVSWDDVSWLLGRVDGFLIMGGADVDPALYGEKKSAQCGEVKPERDALETHIAKSARRMGIPVLGICRGCQVMNVAAGGTLVQDIASELGIPAERHRQPEDYAVCTHDVTVVPETPLAAIPGLTKFGVNSRHHQCIRTLAKDLRVNARSTEDNIIEAFDYPEHPFYLGVQWHPEMLCPEHPEALALFETLVKASAKSL